MDDDHTAWAAIRQPAPTSCAVAAHRRLAGVDDLYTARAAIRQPAPAGCWVAAHRRLAGVDDESDEITPNGMSRHACLSSPLLPRLLQSHEASLSSAAAVTAVTDVRMSASL